MVNWKNRAKKWEQEALTAHENLVKVAFCLEKEKTLHRRSLGELAAANDRLARAIMLIRGASENLAGRNQFASAEVLTMAADDLCPKAMGGCATAPKDEQR